jgi:hypothetical protein
MKLSRTYTVPRSKEGEIESCFNFKAMDEALFDELDQLTARGFAAFRKTPILQNGRIARKQ